jgi:hypothetical protein
MPNPVNRGSRIFHDSNHESSCSAIAEIGRAEDPDVLGDEFEVGSDHFTALLILVALQVKGISLDRADIEGDDAGIVEGRTRRGPVGRIASGVEIAVPDQESVADMEVLPTDRDGESIRLRPDSSVPDFQPA